MMKLVLLAFATGVSARLGSEPSALMTFLDRDGSVQSAGVVLPPCANAKRVLLTLHGTSIGARDSSDAFKMKPKKDPDGVYRFGAEGLWLCAPTRHGAHNWEGIGRACAFAFTREGATVIATVAVSVPPWPSETS